LFVRRPACLPAFLPACRMSVWASHAFSVRLVVGLGHGSNHPHQARPLCFLLRGGGAKRLGKIGQNTCGTPYCVTAAKKCYISERLSFGSLSTEVSRSPISFPFYVSAGVIWISRASYQNLPVVHLSTTTHRRTISKVCSRMLAKIMNRTNSPRHIRVNFVLENALVDLLCQRPSMISTCGRPLLDTISYCERSTGSRK